MDIIKKLETAGGERDGNRIHFEASDIIELAGIIHDIVLGDIQATAYYDLSAGEWTVESDDDVRPKILGALRTLTDEDPALATIRRGAQQVADAETTLDTLRADWHESITSALRNGFSVMDIVDASGLSRPRIYQIRDGRR